jgi:hypothetical protein
MWDLAGAAAAFYLAIYGDPSRRLLTLTVDLQPSPFFDASLHYLAEFSSTA